MEGTASQINGLSGLNPEDVQRQRTIHGRNEMNIEGSRRILHILVDIVKEPMFLLLVAACSLYFILGQPNEGMMMLVAMLFVAAISAYQDARSTRALKTLKQFTEPVITVIRGGKPEAINAIELVPGDVMILEEGNKIPADAKVLQSNDLTVNESVITGEAFAVDKNSSGESNVLYQGTVVNSGRCYAVVTATGGQTVLGKLGKVSSAYSATNTLLQQQVRSSVRRLTTLGVTAFVVIWLVNYLQSGSFTGSLMLGLTLAMAAIPEEIPVALSSFMALGAFHLARLGIITRQPQTIENLGAVNVICLDKTGTITENRMAVKMFYDHRTGAISDIESGTIPVASGVLKFGVLASEDDPFDPMEQAIHEAWHKSPGAKTPAPQKIHEYKLQGEPPMMTHVFNIGSQVVAAGKGAAEKIVEVCRIDEQTSRQIEDLVAQMASKGYRVLGVASAIHEGPVPVSQDEFNWQFEGLLALYDPPRKNINAVFEQIYDAGIRIKLLTGDHARTAVNIATQVGMRNITGQLSGAEVMNMDPGALREQVTEVNLFTRMFPEAKLKVIEALKANSQVVAMTGDGVNDGPALRSADIGIAMGKKGTEVARYAADLVLTDDDLQKIVDAIRYGRKIFSNLKKAVRYIISIHIPIIITAALPVLLGWKFPNIFTPIHVIFLEIIMGPTCSIFFEREPVEKDLMKQPPRERRTALFASDELLISIVQGLVIAAAVLLLYYYFMQSGHSLEETRAIVFTTLVMSNIFLTFANRSFTANISETIHYRNNLAPWVIGISVVFLAVIHGVPYVRGIFGLGIITVGEFALCAAVAFISVAWFEMYKTHLGGVQKPIATGIRRT